MTASTIKEQVTQANVGNLIYLFHIDLNPIGVNTNFYLTPSSSSNILFNGQTYNPFPIEISGLERSLDAAPGRVTMSVSNITQMLAAAVNSYGDMVGASVTYTKTFKNFLDGQPDGGTNQSFPPLRFIIQQKSNFNRDGISFILSTQLDRPNLLLPRRQCLKNDVGRATLFCPGMARTR